MEPHTGTTTETTHVSPPGGPFYFPYNPGSTHAPAATRTLQNIFSSSLQSAQVNVDSLDVGVASAAEATSRQRAEMCLTRSQQQTYGHNRESEQLVNPAVARRPQTNRGTTRQARATHASRTRSQGASTTGRSSGGKKGVAKNEQSSQAEGSASGPNTRLRKRRGAEQASNSESVAPPRKRARGKGSLKKPPPTANKEEEAKKLPPAEKCNCCICMCDAEPEEIALINGCDHTFCFECIEKWADRENTCPLCKVRFTKIDRMQKQRRKKGTKNTKKVKQRDQRSDLVPGAALEGLLANFASRHPFPPHSIARLIFSGVGNGFIEFNNGRDNASLRGRPSIRGLSRNLTTAEDSLFSSDDDTEEEHPFTGFFRAVHGRSVVMGSGMPVVRPVSFAASHLNRSYATNMNDRNAGNGAENPLEIEDDSDDEEIEVVQVMRPS